MSIISQIKRRGLDYYFEQIHGNASAESTEDYKEIQVFHLCSLQ